MVNTVTTMLTASLGGSSVVGKNPQWITIVRNGFPYRTLESARTYWQVDEELLRKLVGLSTRTVARRKAKPKPLTSEQSERVYRFCKLMATATDVLESREVAASWVETPNVAIDGMKPIDLLDTGIGFQRVLDVLTRIEFGVYS